MLEEYCYYSPSYVDLTWNPVSAEYVAKCVLKSCPELNMATVLRVLSRDSDGRFYGFEINDWVRYFKEKMYLN